MRSIPYHNGKTVYISAGDKPPPYIPNVCQADISLLAQQGISRATTLCISRLRKQTYHECVAFHITPPPYSAVTEKSKMTGISYYLRSFLNGIYYIAVTHQ